MSSDDPDVREHLMDLEVKLAYQERLIRELDALVRDLAERVIAGERAFSQLKQTVVSGEVPMGPAGEKPPHY